MSRPVHPAADVFPRMDGAAFEALCESMRVSGYLPQHPIVVDAAGRLLDGRNREAAAEAVGIDPVVSAFDGDETAALNYIVAANVQRRHLNDVQKSYAAVQLRPMYEAAARARISPGRPKKSAPSLERFSALTEPTQRALDMACQAVGAGKSSAYAMQAALEVEPDLAPHFSAGTLSVLAGSKVAGLPPAQRTQALSQIAAGEKPASVVKALQQVAAREALVARRAAAPTERRTLIQGDAVECLKRMPAASVHCVVTDPPYGLDVHRTRGGGQDYADGEDYALHLLDAVCREMARVLTDDAHVYVFSGYTFVQRFKEIVGRHFDVQDNPIVWVKDNHTMCDFSQWYASRHEYIVFARRGKARPLNAKCSPDVIECGRGTTALHSAAKPVALLRTLIENSTQPDDVVLDPFAGSGSTLDAAVECGRYAVGIELDETLTNGGSHGSV